MVKTSSFYAVWCIISVFLLLLLCCCAPTVVIRKLRPPSDIITVDQASAKSSLKVHMRNGSLYVLRNYNTALDKDTLLGMGDFYNADRKKVPLPGVKEGVVKNGQQIVRIPYSDIALVETNKIGGVTGKLLAMGFVGVPSTFLSVFCLANPKACFGSCPTFYAWNGKDMKLMAEGFSSSILRKYEQSDIDMLYWTKTEGRDYHLRLTNEALETHIIRYADLLIFPKKDQERVFATEEGKFYRTSEIHLPAICKGPEGDCMSQVLVMDSRERFSASDPKNLATREYIDLEFNSGFVGQAGLVIGARQTLLTTYLFYQSLAYVGNENGYYAAKIESGDVRMQKKVQRIWDLLGGIEVFVQTAQGKWLKAGEIREMGPIASDVHLVPLPIQSAGHVKMRLKMTRGLWRIDYLGLAGMSERVEPVCIKPSYVTTNDSINPGVLTQLCDTIEPLITLPGDSHVLHYTLPESSGDYEIFLKSKGYYLEWMRDEWMAEKNLKKAYLMFGFPKLYLRLIAKKFKLVEPGMEESFWRSRYVKN